MLIRKAPDIGYSEVTPQSLYLGRREFLQTAAGALAAAAILDGTASAQTGVKLPNVQQSRFNTTERQNSYRDITTYNNYYEFGSQKDDPAINARRFVSRPWTVKVEGLCNKPGDYNVDDLIKGPALEERIYRMRCVEAWSMVIPWVGVPLAAIVRKFEPQPSARFVEFQTLLDPVRMPGQRARVIAYPYLEGLRMDEAMHPLAILAVGLYGEALLPQNGAPIRLVVPWKYGFKGIKAIVRIRFSATQPVNTWQREVPEWYGFYANVNPAWSGPRQWSQATERRLGEFRRRETQLFNGYGGQVASLYSGMDLRRNF